MDEFKKAVLTAIATSAAGEPAQKAWARVATLAGDLYSPADFEKCFEEEIDNFKNGRVYDVLRKI
jgi:hypothetical protein